MYKYCTILIILLFLSCDEQSNQIVEDLSIQNHLLPDFIVAHDSLSFMNISERMHYYNVPGISWAIIENDTIVLKEVFGFKDFNKQLPVDENTLFQSASTGKSLTATLALMLVDDGLLSLDEDVNNILKSWKVPETEFTKDNPITLRHLLSHTSGLSTHGFDGYKKTDSLPTIYQILDGLPPANSEKVVSLKKPSKEYQYSGGGYVLIQLLIEEATGKPFEAVAREKLLAPLELKNTVWGKRLPKKYWQNASHEYHKGNQVLEGGWYNLASLGAGGGLWTTPSDLAEFIIHLNRCTQSKSKIKLSKQLATEMQTQQATNKEFGLGLFLEMGEDFKAIYHPGGNMGFRTMMYYIPETKQGVVIMGNSDNAWHLFPEVMRAASSKYKWPSYKTKMQVERNLTELPFKNFNQHKDPDILKKEITFLLQDDAKRKRIYDELSNQGADAYQIWRMEEAIAAFKVANEMYADSLDTYINLGMAYRRDENYIQALDVFKKALDIDVQDDFIKGKIAEIEMKLVK